MSESDSSFEEALDGLSTKLDGVDAAVGELTAKMGQVIETLAAIHDAVFRNQQLSTAAQAGAGARKTAARAVDSNALPAMMHVSTQLWRPVSTPERWAAKMPDISRFLLMVASFEKTIPGSKAAVVAIVLSAMDRFQKGIGNGDAYKDPSKLARKEALTQILEPLNASPSQFSTNTIPEEFKQIRDALKDQLASAFPRGSKEEKALGSLFQDVDSHLIPGKDKKRPLHTTWLGQAYRLHLEATNALRTGYDLKVKPDAVPVVQYPAEKAGAGAGAGAASSDAV